MNQWGYSPHPVYYGLYPFSLIYGAVQWIRRRAYGAGLLRSVRLPVPVVSVGNITLGGTGKTPFVIGLVRFFQQKGLKPCVLSRGYRRKGKGPSVVCDGERIMLSPAEAGDEPYLIARKTKCIVAVGSNRLEAFKLVEHLSPDVVVLDDGFQHLKIERDLDFCLIDGTRGLGNGLVFPAGPLRELPSSLRFAGALVITKRKNFSFFYRVGHCIDKIPVFFYLPKLKVPFVERAVLVTAIGNPRHLVEELKKHVQVVEERVFPDHHWFREGDFEGICYPILTTEKDIVKFPKKVLDCFEVKVVELDETLPSEITSFVEERLCL